MGELGDPAEYTHRHPRGGIYKLVEQRWWLLHSSRWVKVTPEAHTLLALVPRAVPETLHGSPVTYYKEPKTAPENSGGSCSYYEAEVYSVALDTTQKVECKDVMTTLQLTHDEMNIFKEVWRSAAARLGKQKEGHTALRGAQKIKFFADENLARAKHSQ